MIDKHLGKLCAIAVIFSLAAALLHSASATEQAQVASAGGQWLSAEQVDRDIALAEEAYLRIHPGYTRYATEDEMSLAWQELRQKARNNGGIRLDDFYLDVQNVLTLIRCDHTKAEIPDVLIEERKSSPVYLPMRWSVIEGRGIVRIATEVSGLEYGDEILAIDGRPLGEMISEVAPLIPVDGYTEWSRTSGISESLEFRGGAVDHFGALLWNIRTDAVLSIEKPSGQRRDVTVQRIHYADWLELGKADGVQRNFKDAITFERLGDKAAYLSIDTFVNYRDFVEPDEIYDPIFDALKKEQRETLILDLRRNGGGSGDAQLGLLNRIMLKKTYLSRDVQVKTLNIDGLREHLWTWEKAALNPNRLAFKKNKDGTYSFRKFAGQHGKIKPKSNAFRGRLIVLTSHSNSSASATILAHLKDSGRATLIGEKAGGSAEGSTAGVLFTLTLPESGIKTRVPVMRFFTNVKNPERGLSVSPDIYVPQTVKAVRARQDPALESAKMLVKQD